MTATTFTTPVGRLVQGDAFVAQTTDQQGAPRLVKTGPNAGQPNPQFYAGVAFRKDDPAWPAFYTLLDAQARADFPHLFPTPGAACVNPLFSFKIIDGDGLDTGGKKWSDREGFAGHWVVRFASSFAPKVFNAGQYDPMQQVTDPRALKRGYYVRVNGSCSGNGNAQRPGLYLNLTLIEISAIGPEIVSGPNASEAFGGASAPLPAGATPLAAAPAPQPVAAPAPAPAAASPSPVAASPVTASPAPPPAPAAPAAPAPAPVRQMTAAANGVTYDAHIAAGWTDDQLVANGLMLPQ